MAKITKEMMQQILQQIGGSANIKHCGNCMTRLRLTLNNDQLVDKAELKKIPGVLGVIESDEQLQIVLGPGKAQAASDLMNQMLESGEAESVAPATSTQDLNEIASANKQQLKKKQTSAVHRFLSKFATIFTPLIPGFIGAGLLMGLASLLSLLVANEELFPVGSQQAHWLASLIAYMAVFGKALFTFMGLLIGYNAQKAFGGSGVNGAIIAGLFILGYDPEATKGFYSGMTDFFGWYIDPRGNIIGILIACIFGAWVEKQVRKFIPASLDIILTSTITLLIVGAATFIFIMPVGVWLFEGMSWLFMHLNGNPIGTAVLAGLFLIAVMFGVHQGFIPVYVALVETQGFNSLFPILAMAGAGQVGAALALYVKAKKGSVTRGQIGGALFPGFLGIGEPLIYGVTLPRVKPFITACFGGAAGGFFIGAISWMGLPVGLNTVFGPSGLIAIPLMTSAQGVLSGMAVYIGGLAVAYICGFIFTYFFGSKDVDLD
ncbi:PTS N-acetylmuramic acid transporter subunit IIBC [Providencia sneebia]|uniref:PTS system N-acetylmuramic acid-specific EIIBC component n=1 Tax=Providencia sneebia DSM 19967 TaxID=1141660 RepID=K8WK92_9GAMM|nr:PTS N-acetylmuramic acid transporter subunit IIBC [Providencia sneebia]EKT61033.1 PTS system N-acetylmuramic acid transporter subunits IIBC [Providencia sneebia DSM 19967]